MSTQDNLHKTNNRYDAFNKRNFEAASENISENLVFHNITQDVRMIGKDGLMQFMNFWIEAFPDATVETKSMVANEEYVITEFAGKGTHTGMLETIAGSVPPTGKKIDVSFCEVFRFVKGVIVESHLYFDIQTLMIQLELA